MDNNRKHYRFQMTFPFTSNKIYKSKSLRKVVRKCYGEFRNYSDIGEGLFCITNLDKDIEYRFKAANKKVEKIKDQAGGEQTLEEKVKLVAELEDDPEVEYKEISPPQPNSQLDTIAQKLDDINANIIKGTDATAQGVEEIAEKISESEQKILDKFPERKDLFDGIEDTDVFNTKLTELYTLQKLRYIEEINGKNECVIL